MKATILSLFLFVFFKPISAQLKPTHIDWEQFLAQHDLTWDSIPANYYAGAILGNGLMGANVYSHGDGSYRWDIGRVDVTENRQGIQAAEHNLFYKARLAIGALHLKTKGKVRSDSMRLVLYDAIATGSIQTDCGRIAFSTYVDTHQNIICIETESTGDEIGHEWEFRPEEAISSRTTFSHYKPEDYLNAPNTSITLSKAEGVNFAIQELLSGYTYVTAWKEERVNDRVRILITVSYENSTDQAIKSAAEQISQYSASDRGELWKAHKKWWNAYYPASFVTFPDAKIESFYWIQQYKLACLTRSDKHIIDLMGPWSYRTPWPAIWWNLNIQLTYSSLFTSNRLELSEPLWRALNENIQSLINNVMVEEWREDAAAIGRSSSYDLASPLRIDLAENNLYEVGNLTWTMFYYYQYCQYKPDREELLERFYPLLKRCIAYYSHIIYKGEDGKYHLPLTASPEYKAAEDSNYDLSALRWGLQTLLELNRTYALNDKLAGHWEDVNTNLTPYPEDPAQGFLIGKDVPLQSSHRHYSHLLMIYPFHLITPDSPSNRERIERSLRHWMSMPEALQGYSYTGSSSIYSLLGNGDRAVFAIKELLNRYIQPNTLYKESGPVIETPLSAIASLNETYIQSWGGKIRVFPAVPAAWKDLCFINLRTEGGFLVSAIRRDGVNQYVQIHSTNDGVCKIEPGFIPERKYVYSPKSNHVDIKSIDPQDGTLELALKKGDVVIVTNGKFECPDTLYSKHHISEQNLYGIKRQKQ